MEKKNFWIAVSGGFLAGIGVMLLLGTLYSYPRPCHKHMRPMPPRIEMMHHHGHHMKHKWHEPSAEMKEHFAKKLGLTDEQKATLEKFRDEDMAKMKPLIEQMEGIRGQMKELWKENRAHFESVLTDEQKEILKNMKKEHKHRYHRHHGHHQEK